MKTSGRTLLLTPRTEAIPRWIRARDFALTLALWAVCAWTWLQLFPTLHAWLASLDDDAVSFELPPIVDIAGQGLALALLLLTAYLIWGFRTWKRSNRDRGSPTPPPIDPAREAELFGVTPAEVAAWRTQESVTLPIQRDGRIAPRKPVQV